MFLVAPLMMLAAAAPATDVGSTRKAYSQCLSNLTQPALEKKMSLADFQAETKSKCADKEASFRAAIVADDKASGMKDAEAQTDADEQASEYRDKIVSEYEEAMKP